MKVLDYEREFFPDPSLALYLPLWKKDGAHIVSEDRHGHQCTVTGAVWTPQGREFDGTDDKIVVPAHSSIAMGDGHTIALWLKVLSWVAYDRILGKYTDEDNRWSWYMHWSYPEISMNYRTDGEYQIPLSTGEFSAGVWQFIATTFSSNGNLFYLYQNNNRIATDAEYTLPNTNSSDLYLGAKGDDAANGNIVLGDVFIFNRELARDEVFNLRKTTKWRYQ